MGRPKIMVIGGGIAGMTCALEAAERGAAVYLVEKTASLGSHADKYCCKATHQCNKCSACLVSLAKKQVENQPRITVTLNSRLVKAGETAKGFELLIKAGQNDYGLKADSVIVATGFSPFDPRRKGEYGYIRNKKVITALELEKAIREKGSFTAAFGQTRKIGFVQCVGSRDLQLGYPYCSRVCCMYTAKLAKLIKSELPGAVLSIFYTDLQATGRGFDRFIEACKNEDGIQYLRGIPAKIYGFPYDRLTVKYANSLTGELGEDFYDLIVLLTAMTPGTDSPELAAMLGIELDSYGFFRADHLNPVATNVPGVYLAGACQFPKTILQTIQHAKAAAGAALAH